MARRDFESPSGRQEPVRGVRATTLHFSNDAQIAARALRGVEAAVAAGYIDGFPDGTFHPDRSATRAQAAKVLAEVSSRGR